MNKQQKTVTKLKNRGFSLLEALVASGISAVIITSALGTISQIYSRQKQINLAQNFYSETRFFMERVSQVARNNTLDYDRFFLNYGPGAGCTNFDSDQVISPAVNANTPINRANETYPNIFYWDTNDNDEQDRNLGGMKPDGSEDMCVHAWTGSSLTNLYLINGARNTRFAIQFIAENTQGTADEYDDIAGHVNIERQFGADIDGDLIADIWGPSTAGNIEVLWESNTCKLQDNGNGGAKYSVLGGITTEDQCFNNYEATQITPYYMNIENLSFDPAPSRDPFLSFRVDGAQVHPNVFIKLKASLFNPREFGITSSGNVPNISFQTGVSSRVFGNNRK